MKTVMEAAATSPRPAREPYEFSPDWEALVLAHAHQPLLAAAFAMLFPGTPEAAMLTERAQLMMLSSAPVRLARGVIGAHGDTKEFWERIDTLDAGLQASGNAEAARMLKIIFATEIELEQTNGESHLARELVRDIIAQASAKLTGPTLTEIGAPAGATAH